MKRTALSLALCLAFTGAAHGLAETQTTSPASMTAPAPECERLVAEIGHAEKAQTAARDQVRDAWKAVVPLLVAAQLAAGKAQVAESEQRLRELRGDFHHRGCYRIPEVL